MQLNQNQADTPFIRKTVPVKRNGFLLELQVPPPKCTPPAPINASVQVPQPEQVQGVHSIPNTLQAPKQEQVQLIVEQQSEINLKQAQIEETAPKQANIGQSLRDLFKGR